MTDKQKVAEAVARYRATGYDPGMTPDHNGGWVDFSDYEALSARLAEVEAERDDLAKVIDDTESHYGLSSNGNMWRFWSDKAREIAARNTELRAERDRLAAELDAARSVKAAAAVLNQNWPYHVMEPAFDAMQEVEDEGVDTMFAVGIRALARGAP